MENAASHVAGCAELWMCPGKVRHLNPNTASQQRKLSSTANPSLLQWMRSGENSHSDTAYDHKKVSKLQLFDVRTADVVSGWSVEGGTPFCPNILNLSGDQVARLRIRIHLISIQHFRLNSDADPIRIQSGSRVLKTKNWKKVTAEKEIKFLLSKTTNYLSLGLHKNFQVTEEAFRTKKGTSSTSKHEIS
jgi:hypothetical protein